MPKISEEQDLVRLLNENPNAFKDLDFYAQVYVRDPEHREYGTDDGTPLSEGGKRPRGDITIDMPPLDQFQPATRILIGARFKREDPYDAFLRACVYDHIFGNDHHIFDRRTSGKWGSAYDEDTPYIEIPHDSPLFAQNLRETYQKARKYLMAIDSPEFAQMLERLRKGLFQSIESLLQITDRNAN